jgi:hypothetical protein
VTAVDERPHYRTAEQELSDSLEGTAPALSRTVAGLIGPARTAELAKAIVRATDLAVRRHAMDKLADALAVVEEAIECIPPECEAHESRPDLCRHCGASLRWHEGMGVWQAENPLGWSDQCPPSSDRYHHPVNDRWSPDPDEAEQQARVDRFMAGGNHA